MKKRLLTMALMVMALTIGVGAEDVVDIVETVEIVEVSLEEESLITPSNSNAGIMTMATTTYVAQYYSASLGQYNYATSLSSAVSWAQEGTTVTLLSNVSLSGSITVSKDITLDLAGYTISTSGNIVFWITSDVTITDSSAASTGKITSTYTAGNQYIVLVNDGGSLDFNGGMIVSTYSGIQYGNGSGANAGTMSGDAAIDSATYAVTGYQSSSLVVSGGYLPNYTGANCGTLAEGYGISATAETDGVFAGLYKVYALPDTVIIDETKYYSVIDAVEASAYGDALVMTTSATVTQSFTLRTGTTFTIEDGVTLTLTENTSLMNCSNSDVTVYYDGDAHTVKAGELFTAKTLGTPTYVDTESELITALKADDPYIVMTKDITIYSNSLSTYYVTAYFSGTLDGGDNTLTLSAGTEDSGCYLVYYPNDGMVFQNLNVKLESQPSTLCCYQGVSGSRVVLDNITILDSGEVFSISSNWSPFFAHNFGHLIMKDCINEQNFSGTNYQALFIGGYTWAGATTAFVDCINNGSLIGEDVAFFLGNPTYGSGEHNDIAVTDIYVTGFVNNGVLRGTDTASPFSKLGNSTRLDYLNVLLEDEWAYKNNGTIEVAAAYEFSGSIDASTGVISISDGTETAASYGVKMWGYAAIENGGGTSSTFAIMKADSVAEFNGAEMIFGTIIDDITFATEHPGVETYTAPWGENVFTQQPYEIAVIGSTIYYVFDINDNCTLNNIKPRVDIYAYDEEGYVIASATLSSTGVTPTVPSIDMIINDAAFFGTFAEAVTAAADGDTITLLADVDASETATVSGKAITLDLNGNDLTFSTDTGITNSGTLSVKDSVGGGVLDGTITNTGTIAISSGLFTATLESAWAATGYEVTTEGAYDTVQPASTVEYSVIGNTIYGKLDGVTVGKLSILAPEDLVYTNSAKEAYIYDENSGVLGSQTIVYNTTNGNAPTEAGTYTASITATIDDEPYTASITYAISRVSVGFTVENAKFETGHYVAPTLAPTVDDFNDYEVSYTDADGNVVELNNETEVGTYTIVVKLTNANYKLSGTVGSVVVYEVEPETYDLTFAEDGDDEMTDVADVIATTVHTLPTPIKSGYTFAGWTYNGKIYTAGAQFVQPEADVTMTGTWIENKMVVSGVVTDNDDAVVVTATVTLENVTGTPKTTTTTETGAYSFKDIAPGTYTLSVTKGEVTSSKTITVGTIDVTEDFKMTEISSKTTVVVEDGLTETSVSNLDSVTSAVLGDTDAESSVEVKLAVSSVEDSDVETAVANAVASASAEIGHMVDISINAITDGSQIAPISATTDNVEITIALPADLQGMASYKVYRYHVGENGVGAVDFLTTSQNNAGEYIELVKTPGTDEEGNAIESTTSIIIHAKYFSAYAITASDVVSSSSSGTSYYTSSVASTSNGDVSISSSKSSMNSTVTITTNPDAGYEVGEVTVTYSSGKEVSVTDNGDGTYSYLQPGASVTVTVTFVATGEEVEDDTLFDDVDEDAYYYDAVLWAVENGITAGYADGTFRPTDSCTRAQAVTFLWRAAGEPEATMDNPFSDLDETAYYYDAVLWAVENGITTGYDDGTFRPDTTCNRGAIVTFLYRAAGEPDVSGETMSDVADGAYYYDAVLWAVENGITTGYSDGTFQPTTTCNRGAIVTFLYRYLGE